MSGASVRAFLAVELPPEVREQVVQAAADLRRLAPERVRWVPEENLHLTLKFLGEIPSDRLPKLISQVERKLASVAVFEAELGGFGAFPSAKRARILWLGVTAGGAQLARVARKLDAAAAQVGVARERRPYSAHLTLGRLREPDGVEVLRAEPPKRLPFRVEEVVLYESRLSSTGAVYVPLARLPFREADPNPTECPPEM